MVTNLAAHSPMPYKGSRDAGPSFFTAKSVLDRSGIHGLDTEAHPSVRRHHDVTASLRVGLGIPRPNSPIKTLAPAIGFPRAALTVPWKMRPEPAALVGSSPLTSAMTTPKTSKINAERVVNS
jgi:hypothetical protein